MILFPGSAPSMYNSSAIMATNNMITMITVLRYDGHRLTTTTHTT